MVKDIDFTKYIVPQEITENGVTIRDKISILNNCEKINSLASKSLSDFERYFYSDYTTAYRLRQEYDASSTKIVSNGFVPIDRSAKVSDAYYSFCPTLTLELPFKVGSLKGKSIFGKIEKVKDGDTVYHTISVGAYPQSRVKRDESEELEKRHSDRDKSFVQTGKLYTIIIDYDKNSGEPVILRLPEYEYNGQRYVVDPRYNSVFFKVEPLKFRIYDMTTREIKNAHKLNLVCDSLFTGLPYYPNYLHSNCAKWQNSMIRAYINSAKSSELEKDPRFIAPLGWDFSTYGLLYEALNQAREPLKEITFDGERIPDRALYHCDNIEKVNILPSVKYIGDRAFQGWKEDCKLKKIVIPASVTRLGNTLGTFDQVKFENIMNIKDNENDNLKYGDDGFYYVYIAKDGSDVILSRHEDNSLEEDYLEQEGSTFSEIKKLYKFYKASSNPNVKQDSKEKGEKTQKGVKTQKNKEKNIRR